MFPYWPARGEGLIVQIEYQRRLHELLPTSQLLNAAWHPLASAACLNSGRDALSSSTSKEQAHLLTYARERFAYAHAGTRHPHLHSHISCQPPPLPSNVDKPELRSAPLHWALARG